MEPMRHELYGQGEEVTLVERTEVERLPDGSIEFRRYGGDLSLVEQRAASGEEIALYESWEDEVLRAEARQRVSNAVSALETWGAEHQTHGSNYASMTATQRTAADAQLHRRVGIFFDRFADLLRHLRIDV